eukprot:TRINITY_DN14642_c0_g1_i1.p1 TRINITY_DN14642_c0_g1~~TRINITY_DN14642_c0_g1_i1.p1  ORF type:complete len:130 (+),score=22.83 TRINITY_DN14642_c0_g1_i1:27-392(+)
MEEEKPPGNQPKFLKNVVTVVSERAQEFGNKKDLEVGPEVIAEITRFVSLVAKSTCGDLKLFSQHAKRSLVSPEDVLLLARKHPSLKARLLAKLADHQTAKTKPNAKRASPPTDSRKKRKT